MSAAEGMRPGRLWSLWDMMSFNAAAFFKVTTAMQHTLTTIESRKEEFDRLDQDGGMTVRFLDREFSLFLLERAKELQSSLLVLEARVTSQAVDDLIRAHLDDGPISYTEIADWYREIHNTLKRELRLINLFVLEAKNAEMYNQREPLFGSDVESQFPTAAFEIDEAGKCIALGRHTASVFHLMRVLEIGVAAVARCLGISDPIRPGDRNWGSILKKISEGIDKKWPTSAARAEGDGAIFEALHASLDSVKNPWRNATMHVENKYTADEAEHIFVAVKGFMRRLADRCDELGLPLV